METMNYDKRREKAEKRVEEIVGFYTHLLTYCIVNFGLFCLNYFSTPGHFWVQWPIMGWGIGLLCHGLSLYKNGPWGENWKERKIKELMDKE